MPTNTKQQLCIKPTGFLVNLLTDVGPRDMFSDRASVIIESYIAESALSVQL